MLNGRVAGESPVVHHRIVAGCDRNGRFKNDIELGARTLKIFPERRREVSGSTSKIIGILKKGRTDDLKFITRTPVVLLNLACGRSAKRKEEGCRLRRWLKFLIKQFPFRDDFGIVGQMREECINRIIYWFRRHGVRQNSWNNRERGEFTCEVSKFK